MKISPASPFNTFWQAGYEGSDHINRAQKALSMNRSTGHLANAFEDYSMLRKFGIKTVRESIGWRLIETNGGFDFSSIEPRARAAQKLGIQVCWTLCHYGWPEDIDIYSPEFIARFARFCRAVAQYLVPFSDSPPVYSPFNEISFTSWGLSVHLFHCKNMFYEAPQKEAKRQLVRATLAGCDAIWEVSPSARIMHCDPIIHVVPPLEHPEWAQWARDCNSAQYDAWDMLCGRRDPDLGGHPRYLDLIGANYYHDNQWECGTGTKLWWHLGNARRRRLHEMLSELHMRYHRPILLAETSHVGSGRGIWIKQVAAEVAIAGKSGVRCLGMCLYPAIDRHDWEDDNYWHHSGLWDIENAPKNMKRILAASYAEGLRQAQQLIENFQTNTSIQIALGVSMPTIIVFCHLRWDFVYQRPQHLLTQLAQHFEIIFVEEPFYHPGESFLKTYKPALNVTVCQPHTPIRAAGFHDDQLSELGPLITALTRDDENPIVWFYTPMAILLLKQLRAALVVYDCMDELSAFKNAPKQLLQRERALLNTADIVFTGGPSLYEAKRALHPNVHCFPSSVDAVHFEQALDRRNGHPLQASIRGPKLGFYGVIDERFDLGLISALADSHPSWNIVLVGPVVKIDPDTLPRRDNIHYLGQQPYQALPQFLADWDVCLLPFALNEATRFISPTKVLEYMAAELPIVSTAINDVVVPYGKIVTVAYDIQEFIAACEMALSISVQERAVMAETMRSIIATTSWERTADRMFQLIDSATPISRSSRSEASERTDANDLPRQTFASINSLRRQVTTQKVGCAIVGAGPTGLSAAYHSGADTVLLERNSDVGGWCRSIKDKGFTFDYAGHIMFSNDPYVLSLYDILLGDNQHWQNREAWIYSNRVHTRYPFQGALFGLPPEIIKECIVGAVEARYAPAVRKEQAATQRIAHIVEDCCADGISEAVNASRSSTKHSAQNFEEFIYTVWGAGIAKYFAIPYNRKLWTLPLTEMETSWLGGRVPLPDLGEIINGALQPTDKPMGPNARFGYPLRGGFQALASGFLPHIQGQIELNADAVQILPRDHLIVLADGRRFRYDNLISTMPLPELVRLMRDEAPKEIQEAAQGLRHISVRCVNIGINRENVTDKHWIYYPEDTIFHRIFVQGNASPECNAPGGFCFTCEISYSPWKPLPVDGDDLISRCIEDCIKVGMMDANDTVMTANLVDMPYAYVIYDHARTKNVAAVKAWMEKQDIVLAGRYSEWEYYNSDHAFLAGKKAAEAIVRQARLPKTGAEVGS